MQQPVFERIWVQVVRELDLTIGEEFKFVKKQFETNTFGD